MKLSTAVSVLCLASASAFVRQAAVSKVSRITFVALRNLYWQFSSFLFWMVVRAPSCSMNRTEPLLLPMPTRISSEENLSNGEETTMIRTPRLSGFVTVWMRPILNAERNAKPPRLANVLLRSVVKSALRRLLTWMKCPTPLPQELVS